MSSSQALVTGRFKPLGVQPNGSGINEMALARICLGTSLASHINRDRQGNRKPGVRERGSRSRLAQNLGFTAQHNDSQSRCVNDCLDKLKSMLCDTVHTRTLRDRRVLIIVCALFP